jgi:uncharacterized membrane protein
MSTQSPRVDGSTTPFRLPLLLFGIGLGGFVDGIVLHQILQWHHMLSDTADRPVTTVGGLEANTLADGLFHAAAFVVTLVAVLVMARTRRSFPATALTWGVVAGWLLVGWGAFNIVEGLVDHHLLTLHHVRDDVDDPTPWDLGFLAISAVLVAAGVMLLRSTRAARDR